MSEYYQLTGLQALLVDSAIEWARLHVHNAPDEGPKPLHIRTKMQYSEQTKK